MNIKFSLIIFINNVLLNKKSYRIWLLQIVKKGAIIIIEHMFEKEERR